MNLINKLIKEFVTDDNKVTLISYQIYSLLYIIQIARFLKNYMYIMNSKLNKLGKNFIHWKKYNQF